MDAYILYQNIFKLWQKLAYNLDSSGTQQHYAEVPVYVDGKKVTDVVIENNKIIIKTK